MRYYFLVLSVTLESATIVAILSIILILCQKMNARFSCVAVLLATAIIYASFSHAMSIDIEDNAGKQKPLQERAGEAILKARDGPSGGSQEEEGESLGSIGDVEGDLKGEKGKKVEITEYEGNNSNEEKKSQSNDNDNWKDDDDKSWKNVEKESSYEKKEKESPYEKNEKNAYEKKEEPKSDYGNKLKLSGYADVIPANQNRKTLAESYRLQKQEYGAEYQKNQYANNQNGGHQPYNDIQLLLLLKHGRDFASWDPRNNNSQWTFAGNGVDAVADNAAYVVHSGYGGSYSGEKWQEEKKSNAYGQREEKKDKGYVVQYSLPFNKYYNSSDPNNVYDYNEGVVQTKANYTVGPSQRLLIRSKFSCKVINADRNPFPASQVSNPWDDPRLGNCFIQLVDNDGLGLILFISATNTGIWANYARDAPSGNSSSTGMSFIAKRRIGRRARYDTLIDAGIEYDRRQGVINYYLNGYLVWTIYAIGIPPQDDGVNNIDRGQGDPQIVQPTSFTVQFGTGKCLDESDPNVPSQRQRLVRVQGNSTYYSANDTFYDENNQKSSQLWGEGAIATWLKLLILRAESVIYPQRVLPGVYGAEQQKYHKQ